MYLHCIHKMAPDAPEKHLDSGVWSACSWKRDQAPIQLLLTG